MAEIRIPGWRERALTWRDPRSPTSEEQARRTDAKLQARADSPECRAIIAILRRRGTRSARELAAELVWDIYRTRKRIGLLVSAGRIERTAAHANTRNQAYRLPLHEPDAAQEV